MIGKINFASIHIGVLRLHELAAPVEGFFYFGCIFAWLLDEHARRGPLCLAGLANLGTTLHVNVGDILLFAEDGQVAEHIDGRDISGNDH